MAARASMAALITQVRDLIQDNGSTEVFTDEQLEQFLDDNRIDANYLEMRWRESIAPGGSVSYYEYRAAANWETTATVTNNQYGTVTAGTVDYRRGVWTFATSQEPPLYVTGARYNVYAAAAAALEQWMATLKFTYDFTADGATFRRSQQVAAMQALLDRYRSMAGPQVMTMTRSDVY